MSDRVTRAREIENHVDAIRRAWLAVPELRLGQLVVNALPLGFANDPFYINDDILRVEIEKFVQSQGRSL